MKAVAKPSSAPPGANGIAARFAPYLGAVRPHQWLKNILVFTPALGAHAIDDRLLRSGMALVAFSLVASSGYLVNDLLDLANDRAHPRKRLRPLASGALSPSHGVVMIAMLLLGAATICLTLPAEFALILGAYFALALTYSLSIKRLMVADVVTLACLYGMRMLAGSAASGVSISPWLAGLAIFLFLSLALIKRVAELADQPRKGSGDLVGRGYRTADLPILQAMAVASGYVSVLVLALYLNGDSVTKLYFRPQFLWGLVVVLLYWVSRIFVKTARGEMHDDPVIFALTDRVSLLCVTSAAILFTVAAIR
jgi:4-hydroxybenzoate polyprenyltransferase